MLVRPLELLIELMKQQDGVEIAYLRALGGLKTRTEVIRMSSHIQRRPDIWLIQSIHYHEMLIMTIFFADGIRRLIELFL